MENCFDEYEREIKEIENMAKSRLSIDREKKV